MSKVLDKKVIRLSFDAATESCVRLLAFGSLELPFAGRTGYNIEIAENLAHNDLINLAIAGRRLAEAGNLYEQIKSHAVGCQAPAQISPSKWKFLALESKINLWELYGRIIHSSEFDIIAHDFWIKSKLGLFKNDYEELSKAAKFKNHFKPIFRLTTDRVPLLFCEIIDVATTTVKFLECAADELEENDISLGEYEFD
jgi:hypothetical protein